MESNLFNNVATGKVGVSKRTLVILCTIHIVIFFVALFIEKSTRYTLSSPLIPESGLDLLAKPYRVVELVAVAGGLISIFLKKYTFLILLNAVVIVTYIIIFLKLSIE